MLYEKIREKVVGTLAVGLTIFSEMSTVLGIFHVFIRSYTSTTGVNSSVLTFFSLF